MFSLLFISDRPKVGALIKLLQPGLRSKIVLASNYDYGVKHVFEQKISLVAIQSQIGEATCEGVVRHIQNLLGSDAPSFILLDDASMFTPEPGLFDHTLNLSESERSLVSTFYSIMTPEAGGWRIVPGAETKSGGGAGKQLRPAKGRVESMTSRASSSPRCWNSPTSTWMRRPRLWTRARRRYLPKWSGRPPASRSMLQSPGRRRGESRACRGRR